MLNTLSTQEALTLQSLNFMEFFKMIRQSLFFLGATIVENRNNSIHMMHNLVQDLSHDLLRIGLEEDQEEFLLNRIDTAIDKAMVEMDAGKEIREALTFILMNLKTVLNKQNELLNAFTRSLANEAINQSSGLDDNVELF